MTETQYKNMILKALKDHKFKVWEEVTGVHIEGQKVRIDAIVQPPFLDDVYFGIEFKGTDSKSLNYTTKHIKQAVDYSYTYFGKDSRRLYIFLCPNPFTHEYKNQDYGQIAHLLNQFNIGVIDETKYGLTFILGGHLHHRIWSEMEGFKELGKKRNYEIKIGSQ